MPFAVLAATLALLLDLLDAATRGDHAETVAIVALRQLSWAFTPSGPIL